MFIPDCEENKRGRSIPPFALCADIFMAMFAAFALVMDMNVRSGNNYVNWRTSLPEMPVVTVLFAVLLYALYRARMQLPKSGWGMRALALALGAWQVLARSVANTQNVLQPFLSSSQVLKSAVVMLGMAVVFDLLFRLLHFALGEADIQVGWMPRVLDVYRRHTALLCGSLVMLAWLGQLVIHYQGSLNYDSLMQLRQWLGMEEFTSHHPPFGTLLIGLAVNAGQMLGNVSLGLCLYVLLQALLGASAIGCAQSVMRKLSAPRWLRLISMFTCCFCFVYCENIAVMVKDIPYSYGMLLMMCEAAHLLFVKEEKWTAAHALRMAFGAVFVLLMRNNGKYIVVPLLAALALYMLVCRAKRYGVACAALLAALVLSTGFESWMMQHWNITPGSRAEALSLPFQQTARFISKHEDEIPPEEREAIDAILNYDRLAHFYNPVLSDPVKATYKRDSTDEQLLAYFGVWFRQFLRDPQCYVEATLIQNALLFDPYTQNLAHFMGTGMDEEVSALLDVAQPALLKRLDGLTYDLNWMIYTLPLMAQLNSVGFHCILLVFACVLSAGKRLYRMSILLLPMVLSMLVLVAGPCIENQDRYGFPIIYCMPVLLACLSLALRKKKA